MNSAMNSNNKNKNKEEDQLVHISLVSNARRQFNDSQKCTRNGHICSWKWQQ